MILVSELLRSLYEHTVDCPGQLRHEIKLSLAITAEDDIEITPGRVESSIEVTFKWQEKRFPAP
jgi:hypothetical protein